MEGFHLCIMDRHSTMETLVNKLEHELEEDLKCFKVLHAQIELSLTVKLSSLLPFRNKEIFSVVSRVDREVKVIELLADVELQAFVFEETNRPNSFWTLSLQFYTAQEVAKFPSKCVTWTRLHVDYWFQWAVRHFKLRQRDSLKVWDFDGKELCSTDPNVFENETFRAHLKILCQFDFVCSPIKCIQRDEQHYTKVVNKFKKLQMVRSQPTSLWEFLLQLLIDVDSKDVIVWCDDRGKFKVTNPEKVSLLWGQMNLSRCSFDSMHRVIVKGTYKEYLTDVPDEKYTYQFVIDIGESLGISPTLIDQLRQST